MKETVFAIGALGGSGTRICAEILIQAKVYMGDELNEANDNLLFTKLFKNPIWFEKSSNEEKLNRLEIFRKCMIGEKITDKEYREIVNAVKTNPIIKANMIIDQTSLENRVNKNIESIWGWKEPNSHIYLDQLYEYFPDFKYIHVVRHGLDMAFSSNTQQLKNWGYKFDVEFKADVDASKRAIAQLEFWIRCNKYVVSKAKKLFRHNFYLLNYNDLCSKPIQEIQSLLNFLNIQSDDNLIYRLSSIPQHKLSNNRYKTADLTIFSAEQIEEVKRFGFEVN